MAKIKRTGQKNDELTAILDRGQLMEVPLDQWYRDEAQPRPYDEVMEGIEEFADEIEKDNFELAQWPTYHIDDDGRFKNVIGERRTQSFILKGRPTIWAVCKKWTEEEQERLFILQYIENDDRKTNKKPLSAIADAQWWQAYADRYHNGKLSDAAKARSFSVSDVSNRVSILKASDDVKDFVSDNDIRDPATIAALSRLYKKAKNLCIDLMKKYESKSLKGPLRLNAEKASADLKKSEQAAAQGEGQGDLTLTTFDDPGAGESGALEANGMLDLIGEEEGSETSTEAKPKKKSAKKKPTNNDQLTDAIFQAQELLNSAVLDAQIIAGEVEATMETQQGVSLDDLVAKLNQVNSAVVDTIEFYESMREGEPA